MSLIGSPAKYGESGCGDLSEIFYTRALHPKRPLTGTKECNEIILLNILDVLSIKRDALYIYVHIYLTL